MVVPAAQVVAWYRLMLDRAVPSCLRRGKTEISHRNVPYIYPTVKLKCWLPQDDPACTSNPHATRHRCQKVGHSCFRNICSFFYVPHRLFFRRVGRAIAFMVSVLTPGWAFYSLDVAFDNLAERVGSLSQPPSIGGKETHDELGRWVSRREPWRKMHQEADQRAVFTKRSK